MNKTIQYILTAYIIILLISSFYNLGILNFVPIYTTIIYLVCSSTLGILAIKGIMPIYFNPKNRSDLIAIIGFLIVFMFSSLVTIKIGNDFGLRQETVASKTFNALFNIVPIIYLLTKKEMFVGLNKYKILRLLPILLTIICLVILGFSLPYLISY